MFSLTYFCVAHTEVNFLHFSCTKPETQTVCPSLWWKDTLKLILSKLRQKERKKKENFLKCGTQPSCHQCRCQVLVISIRNQETCPPLTPTLSTFHRGSVEMSEGAKVVEKWLATRQHWGMWGRQEEHNWMSDKEKLDHFSSKFLIGFWASVAPN